MVIGFRLWAVLGTAVALAGLGTVNDDARWIVVLATLVGAAAALGAAWSIERGHPGVAAALGLASMIIPVWYWYPVLIVPLGLAGAAVLSGRDENRVDRLPG